MMFINTLAVVQSTHAETLAVVQGTSSGASNVNVIIIVCVIIVVALVGLTLFGRKK